MDIAFAYTAEPYQCYHTATIASALAALPGVNVTEYTRFSDTPFHLERIRRATDMPSLPRRAFKRSVTAHALRGIGRLGGERRRLLKENVAVLNHYDAVVVTEYRAAPLKKAGLKVPLILLMHGAGDALVHDEHHVRDFDLVLVPGPKVKEYFLNKGLVTEENCQIIGYPKFELCSLLHQKAMRENVPFGEEPFVLYNPHLRRPLSSYELFLKPLVEGFKARPEKNLLIAPHIKMFQKLRFLPEWRLHNCKAKNIAIDTRTPALLDMSYTCHASLYVGDISSQVYEFLRLPRPCVFLNPQKIRWEGDENYKHWQAGEVVEDPAELMAAIDRAPARHHLYREAQERLMQETFGTLSAPSPHLLGNTPLGPSECGAQAIMEFVKSHSTHACVSSATFS